ncbi:MAG: hypothetical protein V1750_10765, partial [Acidobacteriota bacterium]
MWQAKMIQQSFPLTRRLPGLLVALALAGPVGAATAPAATIVPAAVPAAGRHEAILTIAAFGRYAVTVASQQGVALQLVDRMAGPGEIAGRTGEEDGRLEAFLDRGEFKVVTLGHEKASGKAALQVHPFAERNAPQPSALVELQPVSATLADLEQLSWWVKIDERRPVAIEAAGRNLADLRFWRDGIWLVDLTPERAVITPKVGQPLLACRLTGTLEPGLYLLTAYGGLPQPWAEGDEHPFHLRWGIPALPEAGRRRLAVGPLGIDRYLVPGEATYFRIELPEARSAQLQVGGFDEERPFRNDGPLATIDKRSLPPMVEIERPKVRGSRRLVTITAETGQLYTLQNFEKNRVHRFAERGDYWLSTIHSGHPADSLDATAIVSRSYRGAADREAFLAQAITIDGQHGWARRFNLLDEATVFLRVGAAGKYEVAAKGVTARFRIEPFFSSPTTHQSPQARPSGETWELDPGYFVLTVLPETKGVAEVTVRPYGLLDLALDLLGKGGAVEPAPLQAAVTFPRVTLDPEHSYVLHLNQQPGVSAGVVLRSLPLDLTQALPIALQPGAEITVPAAVREPGTLRAEAEDGTLLPVAVDGGEWQTSAQVEPGSHIVALRNSGAETAICSLAVEPLRLQATSPLPPIPEPMLAELPRLLELVPGAPHFLDLERSASATFLVRAAAPALYTLQSTGLLATAGALRTRTVVALDRQAANGAGRNFLVQQYLREGDYGLTVTAQGASAGHLGVALEQAPIADGGQLDEGVPARATLAAGAGIAYRFTVAERGEYRVRAIGLRRGFRCRLEDGDGWPILAPNIGADIRRSLEPGAYRFVLLPEGVSTRRVTLIERTLEPVRLAGHGPHLLPLGCNVDHLWTETAAEGADRPPDEWDLVLPATAYVSIAIEGEMEGELERRGVEQAAGKVAALGGGRRWSGPLAAGAYRLALRCMRRNNLAPYRVGVQTNELLDGQSRDLRAPAELGVSVGKAGLVELSSFGGADVRASLRDEGGKLVAASDDRPDDWSFLIATQLRPGRYRLRVDPVGAAEAACTVSMRMPAEVVEAPLTPPAAREVPTGRVTHLLPLELGSRPV